MMQVEYKEDWTVNKDNVNHHCLNVNQELIRQLSFCDHLFISNVLISLIRAPSKVTYAERDHDHINGVHFSLKCLCKEPFQCHNCHTCSDC